jgi:hypothetical protein
LPENPNCANAVDSSGLTPKPLRLLVRAPSAAATTRATSEPSAAGTNSVPNSKNPPHDRGRRPASLHGYVSVTMPLQNC